MFKLHFVNEEDAIYFLKIFDKKPCLLFTLEKMSDFNRDHNLLIQGLEHQLFQLSNAIEEV